MNTSPQRIAPDFQPSQSAYEIGFSAGMTKDFIDELIPEFIVYWEESRGKKKSWNSTFINHIKHQWSRKKKAERSTTGAHPQSNKEWIAPVIKVAKSRPSLKQLRILANGGSA